MVLVSFVLNINSDYDSIEKCFSSFCFQSFQDFEIICLNNNVDDKIINLIKSFNNRLSITFSNDPLSILNGEYVCFFNSQSSLSDENSLNEFVSVISNYDCNMFSANIHLINEGFNGKNVFFNNGLKYLNLKETTDSLLNPSMSNHLFRKDFLLSNDIRYDDNEILLFADIFSKVDSFLTVPIDFCDEVFNEPIIAKDCIDIFSTYSKLLSVFSEENELLNNISGNLLNNKFDLPDFTSDEYEVLEKEFENIQSSLNLTKFPLAPDVLHYLRYIKEMAEIQLGRYDVSISIIIPTFNVESFIGDCLCSIINQSFDDFEVIVVDDCSTDSTLDVLDYYTKRDCRIKYFVNSRKCGSGGSRNFGLNKAMGKYVLFVDGDDWLDVNALEKLYALAEKHKTQTVMYKLVNFEDIGSKFIKDDYLSVTCLDHFNNTIFNSNEINGEELFEISVVAMNKLYLRNYLNDINASFPEKYIHQDNPFFYQTFCECERIYLADEYFYNRRLWNGSITHLRDDTELGTVEIVEEILKVFLNNGLYEKYKEHLLNRLLYKLRNRYNLVGDSFKEEYFKRAKAKLNRFMFDYELFDDLVNSLWSENKIFFNRVVYSEDYDNFLKN